MKLFKFICGSDEKIGVFEDDKAAYDRRTEVDMTFHFLPVQIIELVVPGHNIIVAPFGHIVIIKEIDTEEPDPPLTLFSDPLLMTFDELKEWLDSKQIKYHSQIGERKLRDLVIQKWAIAKEAGEL